MVKEKLYAMIADYCGIENFSEETSLIDLGLDESISRLDFAFELEKAFKVKIPLPNVPVFQKVGDILSFLEKKVEEQNNDVKGGTQETV